MAIATSSRDEIRERLKSFVSYDEGNVLREQLHRLAKDEYKPKHSSREYVDWMQENPPTFDKCGAQQTNFPYYMGMFTIASQWVYGDCIQECLDKAMGATN